MTSPEPSRAARAPSTIRPVIAADMPGLKAIIDAVGLFPSEMLDEMMAAYFKGGPGCADFWLTDVDGGYVTIAYDAPERMTSGTWNLYLIAVDPRHQSQGRGAAMMAYVEHVLAQRGERVLLVETSGLPEFERTRAFYRRIGYAEEARIRDLYKAGEDKVILRKALSSPRPSSAGA